MLGLICKDGVVDNIAKFGAPGDMPEGWQVAPEGVAIGHTDNGDGTFSPPPIPEPTDEEKAATERSWRDAELRRADIEINKDEDAAGVFDAVPWRTYRAELRDWPADPTFPDPAYRPVAPDA